MFKDGEMWRVDRSKRLAAGVTWNKLLYNLVFKA